MSKMMMRFYLMAGVGLLPSSSPAVERHLYSYDALGRLAGACHFTNGDGERTIIHTDPADNRTTFYNNATVTVLPVNGRIYSADGQYFMTMQGDGNLVFYGPTTALWASNTSGTGGVVASFQSDGNIVVYKADATPVWASNTDGNYCAFISIVNGDFKVLSYFTGALVWHTNTSGP